MIEYFVPYAKDKKDKNGHEIHFQTGKIDDMWIVDVFEDENYIGRDRNDFPRLVDAEKYINSEIAKI